MKRQLFNMDTSMRFLFIMPAPSCEHNKFTILFQSRSEGEGGCVRQSVIKAVRKYIIIEALYQVMRKCLHDNMKKKHNKAELTLDEHDEKFKMENNFNFRLRHGAALAKNRANFYG